MTISAQTLSVTEKNKFNALRKAMDPKQKRAMDKRLAKIVQTAIDGAGETEADNIRDRIALALHRAFPIGG